VCIWSCHQEASKADLVLVLDHQNVKWWWCLSDFKGHSSAFNLDQTIRYSKIPFDLARKGTLCGKKNRFVLTLVVCSHHVRGLLCNLAIIEGLTKKTFVGKKLIAVLLVWCLPVHCSSVEYFLCILWCVGDRESFRAYNLARYKTSSHYGRARLERELHMPPCFDYGMPYAPLCMTYMTRATTTLGV
jgi:hypothetical protein